MNISHSKPTITQEDIATVVEVLNSGQIADGEKIPEFEKQMAGFLGLEGGVATNSGTSAIHLALIALDIKKDDEVIIPSYVCTSLLHSIYHSGATPIIVDINRNDYNISALEVKRVISNKTKAIIVPHMFGMSADLNELLEFEIPIIEDLAHTIGANYNDKKVGSLGQLCICSFYATKMMATGEGGMVLSNSDDFLGKIKDLREYDNKNEFKIRYNYKMSDLHAALGITQLSKLSSFISRRKEIADFYNKVFSNIDVELPISFDNREHIYYRYVIKIKKELNDTINILKQRNIYCSSPVFKPLHRYLKLDSSKFPITEEVFSKALSIPIYPSLSDSDIEIIADEVGKVL